MNRIAAALTVVLFGLTTVACTTTPAEPRPVLDRELTATGLDEVGLDTDGQYQWYGYKSALPFASEAKESTSIHTPSRNPDVFAKPKPRTKAVSQSGRSARKTR